MDKAKDKEQEQKARQALKRGVHNINVIINKKPNKK